MEGDRQICDRQTDRQTDTLFAIRGGVNIIVKC